MTMKHELKNLTLAHDKLCASETVKDVGSE